MDGQTQVQAQPPIKISVRNLVEFVMRSGDLDNRRTAGAKKEAMQAGSRLHPEDTETNGKQLPPGSGFKAQGTGGYV